MSVLKWIFNNSIKFEYCSKHFKKSIIVVLRKFNKENYSIFKIYKFIALLNIMNKIMKSIVIIRLNYVIEQHNLLSKNHFDDKKNIFFEHALHYIMKIIHSAWTKKKMTLILLLNVIETFDNVFHSKLLHNLRRKKIEDSQLTWIKNFLTNRHIIFKLMNHISQRVQTLIEVFQKSSLSFILYIFYNAQIIEWCIDFFRNMNASDFINDINIIIIKNNVENNLINFKIIHDRCEKWISTHKFIFNKSKYEFIHFRRHSAFAELEMTLQLSKFDFVLFSTCKYLKMIMNSQLIWKFHLTHLKKKFIDKFNIISTLTDFTWNLKMKNFKRTYIITIFSQFIYCVFIWYVFNEKHNFK